MGSEQCVPWGPSQHLLHVDLSVCKSVNATSHLWIGKKYSFLLLLVNFFPSASSPYPLYPPPPPPPRLLFKWMTTEWCYKCRSLRQYWTKTGLWSSGRRKIIAKYSLVPLKGTFFTECIYWLTVLHIYFFLNWILEYPEEAVEDLVQCQQIPLLFFSIFFLINFCYFCIIMYSLAKEL